MVLQIGVISVQATEEGEAADLAELTIQQELKNGDLKDVTITPEFSADVTEYDAVLDPTCVLLHITAIAEDEESKVEIQWPEMDPGDNKTYVNVTAPDGSKKQYAIFSKVPDASETTTEEKTTEKETTTKEEPTTPKESAAPSDENGNTATYEEVCSIKSAEASYTLVQNVSDTSDIPDGYRAATLKFEDASVQAWTMGNGSPFYLVYAVDKNGTLGLYSYDVENQTIQQFNLIDYGRDSNADAQSLEKLQKEYDSTKKDLSEKNSLKLKLIILLALVILVLIFLIINFILKIKELKSADYYDEGYDDEGYENGDYADEGYDDEASGEGEDLNDQDEPSEWLDLEEGTELGKEENDPEELTGQKAPAKKEPAKKQVSVKEASAEKKNVAEDEDIFSDLNIDLTDSILAELTETSQKLEQSSQSVGQDVEKIVKENGVKDMEIPSFNTNNLPNPNRFKFEIPEDDDADDDFEFFDLDE